MASVVTDLLQGGLQAVLQAATFIERIGFGEIVGTLCGVAVIAVAYHTPRIYQAAIAILFVFAVATFTYNFGLWWMLSREVLSGGVIVTILYLMVGGTYFASTLLLLLFTYVAITVVFIGYMEGDLLTPLVLYSVAAMLTSAIVTAISQKSIQRHAPQHHLLQTRSPN